MHEPEKSDAVVVAVNPANKAERSAAELIEPRTATKGNAGPAADLVAVAVEELPELLAAEDPPGELAPGHGTEADIIRKGYGDLDAGFAAAPWSSSILRPHAHGARRTRRARAAI